MTSSTSSGFLRALASLRLTLALLLLLAVAAAVGTALPPAVDPVAWQQRYGTDAPWWRSVGLGGYYNTPVEEVLPLTSRYEKEKQQPSVAMVLVIART